jgi:hypothetical protein
VKKITAHDAPPLIRDRVPFETWGSFRATAHDGGYVYTSDYLRGYDLAMWERDRTHIRYIVWSYSTPIAWWVTDTDDKNMPRVGHWHVVRQTFSPTTSTRHQSKLYLIPGPSRWEPFFDASLRDDLACRRTRGVHRGSVGYTDDGTMCERHYLMRPKVKRIIEFGTPHTMRVK